MIRVLLALFVLLAAVPAEAGKPPRPLFAGDALLAIRLEAPVGTLPFAAPDASVPGTLAVDGETLPVRLALRGLTRRKRDICAFPPLRVSFPEKPAADSLFRGQERLKLVTHCRRGALFQQYILLEYAAYRLYNVMTPLSFKARLAEIAYVDAGGQPITIRYGFFIEPVDDMARRNGLEEIEIQSRLAISALDPAAAARLALFQYMIGNLDWAANGGPAGADCCHNSRPVGTKGAQDGLVPVPYDFDYAGLVNAPYAASPASIQSAGVRVRRFRGFCRHNEEIPAALAAFKARRAELLAVIDTVPGMEPGTRARARAYLADFFADMADPARAAARLASACIN